MGISPRWKADKIEVNPSALTVASGETFVASSDFRHKLRAETHADAVDMNLSGVLAACQSYQLRVLCLRVISDYANDGASEDFKTFVEKYDGRGGTMAAESIEKLDPDPNSPSSYPALNELLRSSKD